MKKFIIPLITVAVVASIMLAGCVPGAAPPEAPPEVGLTAADVPELQELIAKGAVDPTLLMNPYEGLAIKPDGTPFRFGSDYCFLGNEYLINGDGIFRSLIERAGGEMVSHDANFDVAGEVAWVEDRIATKDVDGIIILPVDEYLLIVASEKAMAAGISVVNWDSNSPSNNIVSSVYHNYAGPAGSCILGEYFVKIAEETGKPINIYEIWSIRAMQMFKDRHAGFHRAVDKCDLITVMESPDCMSIPEKATTAVMDAFTAYPELNGVYSQGEGLGMVEGLRGLGLLLPLDDPNHIITVNNDVERAIAQGMRDGVVDAAGTHVSWELCDIAIKQMFTSLILGKPVAIRVPVPMYLVTIDNLETISLFGGALYCEMPVTEWDLWPVLDTTSVGVETPTKAMRMELQGY